MLVVADTSALVSLGTVVDSDPFSFVVDAHRLVVPNRVLEELRETAEFDDPSGEAAAAVLDRRRTFEVRDADLNGTFPLDDGENAAVSLANELAAGQLFCDEFNRLALIHASLAETRLVTTPTLVVSLVRNGVISVDVATALLDEMSSARSWAGNSYVERARETLRTQ